MSESSSSDVQRIEVITSVQRRRRWSVAEKIEIVAETEQPGMSVSYVARRHDISPSLLFKWRRLYREGAFSAIQANETVVAASEVKHLKRQVRELQRLLARHSGKRPERAHEGCVITMSANMRWCSDEFEIACWNGQRMRVAFSLDCCDRELISYVATSGAVNAAMVRDLMVQSIEYRFGPLEKAPHPIEWLSDNGSCCTAHHTRQFAKDLGLICLTTPASSPQSNGMVEAFIKTFKRDYVYIHDRPDAKTVLSMLA